MSKNENTPHSKKEEMLTLGNLAAMYGISRSKMRDIITQEPLATQLEDNGWSDRERFWPKHQALITEYLEKPIVDYDY